MKPIFTPVTTSEDQQKLAHMAAEIWNEYWPAIIGQAQVDYMVDKFQSLEAIQRDMSQSGYEYWFIQDESEEIFGYTGGHEESDTNRFFISKIYLLKSARGKHLCSATVEFYDALCHDRGLEAMYLTVNKHNDLGIRAYKGNGFDIIDRAITDIGNGFVMDDYIMQRTVA